MLITQSLHQPFDHYPQVADKETETQRGHVICPVTQPVSGRVSDLPDFPAYSLLYSMVAGVGGREW